MCLGLTGAYCESRFAHGHNSEPDCDWARSPDMDHSPHANLRTMHCNSLDHTAISIVCNQRAILTRAISDATTAVIAAFRSTKRKQQAVWSISIMAEKQRPYPRTLLLTFRYISWSLPELPRTGVCPWPNALPARSVHIAEHARSSGSKIDVTLCAHDVSPRPPVVSCRCLA